MQNNLLAYSSEIKIKYYSTKINYLKLKKISVKRQLAKPFKK